MDSPTTSFTDLEPTLVLLYDGTVRLFQEQGLTVADVLLEFPGCQLAMQSKAQGRTSLSPNFPLRAGGTYFLFPAPGPVHVEPPQLTTCQPCCSLRYTNPSWTELVDQQRLLALPEILDLELSIGAPLAYQSTDCLSPLPLRPFSAPEPGARGTSRALSARTHPTPSFLHSPQHPGSCALLQQQQARPSSRRFSRTTSLTAAPGEHCRLSSHALAAHPVPEWLECAPRVVASHHCLHGEASVVVLRQGNEGAPRNGARCNPILEDLRQLEDGMETLAQPVGEGHVSPVSPSRKSSIRVLGNMLQRAKAVASFKKNRATQKGRTGGCAPAPVVVLEQDSWNSLPSRFTAV